MQSPLEFRSQWLRQNASFLKSVEASVQESFQTAKTQGLLQNLAPASQDALLQLLSYLAARLHPFLTLGSCQNYFVDALQTHLGMPEKIALNLIAGLVAHSETFLDEREVDSFDPFMCFILAHKLLSTSEAEFLREFSPGKGFCHLLRSAEKLCEDGMDGSDVHAFGSEALLHTTQLWDEFLRGRELTPWYVERSLFEINMTAVGYRDILEDLTPAVAFDFLVAIGMERRMSLKALVAHWAKRSKGDMGDIDHKLPRLLEALANLDLIFIEGAVGSPQMAVSLTLMGIGMTKRAFEAQTKRLPHAVRRQRTAKASRLYAQF